MLSNLQKMFGLFILLCVCVHALVSICPQATTCQPCKACNGLITMNVNITYLFNNNLLTAGWHLVIIQLDGSGITCLLLYLLNLILFLHYFYRILAYCCRKLCWEELIDYCNLTKNNFGLLYLYLNIWVINFLQLDQNFHYLSLCCLVLNCSAFP